MNERDLNAIPDSLGLPTWLSGKELACQCRRCGFSHWVGKTPSWIRKWQPTLVFLPGKFQGQRSLVGYSLRGCKELDMIERLNTHPPLFSSQGPDLHLLLIPVFTFIIKLRRQPWTSLPWANLFSAHNQPSCSCQSHRSVTYMYTCCYHDENICYRLKQVG